MAAMTFDVKDDKGVQVFKLKGAIDEKADFTKLVGLSTASLAIDFEAVENVNSTGIKKWIAMLGDLKGKNVTYERCPTVVIESVNMVPALRDGVNVNSFFLPFFCASCDLELTKLVVRSEATATGFIEGINDRYPCERCNRKLRFFDDESLYFAFLETAS